MGCWNETDGLTQIPIQGGTKVKGIILLPERESFWNGNAPKNGTGLLEPKCHPVLIPVSGTYDEYGSIKDIVTGVSTKYLEATFKKLIEDKKIDIHTRYHLYQKDADPWEIESCIKAIGQSHLSFKCYSWDVENDLEQAAWRKQLRDIKDLTQKIKEGGTDTITEDLAEIDDPKKETKKQAYLKSKELRLTFGLFFVIEDFYNAAVEAMKTISSLETQKYGGYCLNSSYIQESVGKKAKRLKRTLNSKNIRSNLSEYFSIRKSAMGSFQRANTAVFDYGEFCADEVKAGNKDGVKTAIDEMRDWKYFQYFMAYSRKPWYVAGEHRGAQDHEFYLHHALACATNKYCNELVEEIDKHDTDYEEEE